ncbi:4-carboxymuconolactone decarboxylase [Gloeopeniophorella convolvens]|nr:4-carboxymuconolactone decarboxylase [Gloeopeniophorella convolvens]
MLYSPAKALFVLLACVVGLVHGVAVLEKRDDNLPARVPYVFPAPGVDPVADALRSRRPNNTLLDLDGALLNSDSLALAWNGLAVEIRDNNPIPDQMRELIILRTSVVTKSSYIWIQHESVGRSVGLTTAQLRTIRFTPTFGRPEGFSRELAAAFAFTDFATAVINVPDAVFNDLHAFLNDAQIVEAAATVGTYNLVARFVVSLNVDAKMNVPVPIPQ